MKNETFVKRARALYDVAVTSFGATGRIIPLIVFDLIDEGGETSQHKMHANIPDHTRGRDALAHYVRDLCNNANGKHRVCAVYIVSEAWGSSRDMTEDEVVKAVTKYGGGPRFWPKSERSEKIVVAGDTRIETITIDGTINRSDNTVSEPTIRQGGATGRMSRFFEPMN